QVRLGANAERKEARIDDEEKERRGDVAPPAQREQQVAPYERAGRPQDQSFTTRARASIPAGWCVVYTTLPPAARWRPTSSSVKVAAAVSSAANGSSRSHSGTDPESSSRPRPARRRWPCHSL